MINILLVEDEAPIQEMITFTLSVRDMKVECASSVAEALFFLNYDNNKDNNKAEDFKADCVIIDWMLPDKSGIDLVRKIRSHDKLKNLPIIMLTAKSTEKNKLIGFEAGADDYITKPFSPKELVVRINALLKRAGRYKDITSDNNINISDSGDKLIEKNLVIDLFKHEVLIDNKELSFGPIEYKLLVYLLKNKNKVCSREKLMDKVWEGKETLTDRTVDVHIRRVRKALDGTGFDKQISTVRSFGYIFKS
jgi:DNA-binding response OmpR family regulator